MRHRRKRAKKKIQREGPLPAAKKTTRPRQPSDTALP
ncbi:hypothetical protein L901_22690 [Agrobacterium sp. D14]|nr:hypothetical protein L901_22690 [Agrobacterium sp. D14]